MDNNQLVDNILKLKEKRRAVILAHNYQRDEVQDIADFTGDSLELSKIAADVDCDTIVFCGVNFMAESASILSPDKTVLLPAMGANCPMADMITLDSHREEPVSFPGFDSPPGFTYPVSFTLRDIKKANPGVPVVTYVNTGADIKSESDICCTSANVVKVVNALDVDTVICVPDKNLSAWAQKNSKKRIISWDGYCHVHERATVADVEQAKKDHPNALFMAHPECPMAILELADHVTSTSGMLRFAKESSGTQFIVGTEIGLMYKLKKENPDKAFYPLRKDMICPNMKKTSLNTLYDSLNEMKHVVKVPRHIQVNAKKALDRMIEL